MDNDQDFEDRVRDRAYLLWEQAGRPEGQAEEHWRRAATLVECEQDAGPAPANLALTEMAGETAEAPQPDKTPASPRRAGATNKTGDAPSPKPAMVPTATKGKRTPKPAG